MTEMIERMAKAAYDNMMKDASRIYAISCVAWEDEDEALREDWRASIRAALQAAREPTEAMQIAGQDAAECVIIVEHGEPEFAVDGEIRVWHAMIDAALDPVNPDYVSDTPRIDRLGRRVPTIDEAKERIKRG